MVGPVLFNSTKLADQLGSFYDAKVKRMHEELCSVRHRHRSSPAKKERPKKTENKCAKCNKSQHWTGIAGRGLSKKLSRLTLLDRSDLALTCIDCIQRNGQRCFG